MLDKIESILPKESGVKLYKNLVNLSIVGMPNGGKSSLMNCLLKEDKAIVTDIAGTTRDSIDSYIKYFKKDIRVVRISHSVL